MGIQNFILTYAQACSSGKLALSDCGPFWQCGVIAVLLVSAIAFLIALRMRAYEQTA